MKVAKIEEVMNRKTNPTSKNHPSSSTIKIGLLKQVVLIMLIINIIIKMDNIRQEKPKESPILKLN